MSLRRIFALIAMVVSAMIWHAGRRELANTFLGPLVWVVALVVGLVATGVLVFNMQVLGWPQADSGFGLLSERQGNAFGAVLTGLFGGLLIFLALRGLSTRVMPTLWSGPELSV